MPALRVSRLIALTMILLALACAVPAQATTTQWQSMQIPAVLGGDDASIELYPSRAALVDPGLYADTIDPHHFLASTRTGSTRVWGSWSQNATMRVGAVPFRVGGARIGASASLMRNASSLNEVNAHSGRDSVETVVSATEFTLSASFGHASGVQVDAAVEAGQHALSDDVSESGANQPTLRLAYRSPDVLDWDARLRLSLPCGDGAIRANVQGGHGMEYVRYNFGIGYGYISRTYMASGTSRVHTDIAWFGHARGATLVACGVSAEYAKTRQTEDRWQIDQGQRTNSGFRSHGRGVEATWFVGAEAPVGAWAVARCGASGTYFDGTAGDGVVMTAASSTNGHAEFETPHVSAGLGVKLHEFRADVDLDTVNATQHLFRAVSLGYRF